MELKSKTVVLTGAASGIGHALAIQLAAQGCHLALVDRDIEGLEKTQTLVARPGITITCHQLDLANRQQTLLLAGDVMAQHSQVHILINNAGVALGGSFEQTAQHDFDWLMRINFEAVVDLCRQFLPLLKHHKQPAKIVNISSLYGLISPPGQSAYSASKFAVRGFSNALRHELNQSNVGVLVVHPGGIATAIARNAKIADGIPSEEVYQKQAEAKKLLKMPPSQAATQIVDALLRDKARLLIGFDAKLLGLVERLVPVSYWPVVEKLMNAQRK